MSGSAFRFIVAIGFNAAVAFGLHFFGGSLTASWLTFLGLTVFAAVAEIGLQVDEITHQLREIDRKLETLSIRLTSR